MNENSASMGSIKMEITIDAPVSKVWRALTENIGAWWPDDFYAGGQPGQRNFLLEVEAGGRMHETWGSKGGVLWGTVISCDPEKSLQILGHTFPNWGGPTQWYGTWTLDAAGDQTTLGFSESAIGHVSSSGMDEKDKGWRFLWATLKAHVEGTPAPDWQD